MINRKLLFGWFSVRANRNIMIDKINNSDKLEDKYSIKVNKETDKRHLDVLTNWKNISKAEKMSFVDEVLEADTEEAYRVVAEKKTEIRNKISKTKGNLKQKIRDITSSLTREDKK